MSAIEPRTLYPTIPKNTIWNKNIVKIYLPIGLRIFSITFNLRIDKIAIKNRKRNDVRKTVK